MVNVLGSTVRVGVVESVVKHTTEAMWKANSFFPDLPIQQAPDFREIRILPVDHQIVKVKEAESRKPCIRVRNPSVYRSQPVKKRGGALLQRNILGPRGVRRVFFWVDRKAPELRKSERLVKGT